MSKLKSYKELWSKTPWLLNFWKIATFRKNSTDHSKSRFWPPKGVTLKKLGFFEISILAFLEASRGNLSAKIVFIAQNWPRYTFFGPFWEIWFLVTFWVIYLLYQKSSKKAKNGHFLKSSSTHGIDTRSGLNFDAESEFCSQKMIGCRFGTFLASLILKIFDFIIKVQ